MATLAFCLLAGFFVLANPHGANTNGKKLAGVLREYEGTDLNLNSIIGFDYDYFVQFEPYADKNSMEEFIGFKCAILEESVSEGMMNILFVKDIISLYVIFMGILATMDFIYLFLQVRKYTRII